MRRGRPVAAAGVDVRVTRADVNVIGAVALGQVHAVRKSGLVDNGRDFALGGAIDLVNLHAVAVDAGRLHAFVSGKAAGVVKGGLRRPSHGHGRAVGHRPVRGRCHLRRKLRNLVVDLDAVHAGLGRAGGIRHLAPQEDFAVRGSSRDTGRSRTVPVDLVRPRSGHRRDPNRGLANIAGELVFSQIVAELDTGDRFARGPGNGGHNRDGVSHPGVGNRRIDIDRHRSECRPAARQHPHHCTQRQHLLHRPLPSAVLDRAPRQPPSDNPGGQPAAILVALERFDT